MKVLKIIIVLCLAIFILWNIFVSWHSFEMSPYPHSKVFYPSTNIEESKNEGLFCQEVFEFENEVNYNNQTFFIEKIWLEKVRDFVGDICVYPFWKKRIYRDREEFVLIVQFRINDKLQIPDVRSIPLRSKNDMILLGSFSYNSRFLTIESLDDIKGLVGKASKDDPHVFYETHFNLSE